jgi:hypothetical protein
VGGWADSEVEQGLAVRKRETTAAALPAACCLLFVPGSTTQLLLALPDGDLQLATLGAEPDAPPRSLVQQQPDGDDGATPSKKKRKTQRRAETR